MLTIDIRFGGSEEDQGTTERFGFNDEETADAFMMGVASACGWMSYRTLRDDREGAEADTAARREAGRIGALMDKAASDG